MAASTHDIDRLTENMGKMTGALGDLVRHLNGGSGGSSGGSLRNMGSSIKQAGQKFVKAANDHSYELLNLSRGTEGAFRSLDKFARALGVGGIAYTMIEYGREVAGTYRQMMDVGQNFSGSMVNMQIAAAEARLPLKEFSEMITKNAKSVAVLGGPQGFAKLSLVVRDNFRQFGMFGMSLEGINDMLGEYTETQRLFGRLEHLSTQQVTRDMTNLADETTALAALTGKSRKETQKTLLEGMRETSLRARMVQMTGNSADELQKKLMAAGAIFAAQPGEAGTQLTKWLMQTAGRGFSHFSEMGQTMIEAGVPQVSASMDKLKRAIDGGADAEEATIAFQDDFMKEVERSMTTLRVQELAGNKAAGEVINMYTEMRKFSATDLAKKRQEVAQQQKFTKFFNSFEDIWNKLMGNLREGFLKQLDVLIYNIDRFVNSQTFANLETTLYEFGFNFGSLLGKLDLEFWGKTIGNGITWLGEALDKIVKSINWMMKNVDALSLALGGLATFITARFIARVMRIRRQTIEVANGIINVRNGGSGAGAGASGGGSGPRIKALRSAGKSALIGAGINAAEAYMSGETDWGRTIASIAGGAIGSVLGGVVTAGLGGEFVGGAVGGYLGEAAYDWFTKPSSTSNIPAVVGAPSVDPDSLADRMTQAENSNNTALQQQILEQLKQLTDVQKAQYNQHVQTNRNQDIMRRALEQAVPGM